MGMFTFSKNKPKPNVLGFGGLGFFQHWKFLGKVNKTSGPSPIAHLFFGNVLRAIGGTMQWTTERHLWLLCPQRHSWLVQKLEGWKSLSKIKRHVWPLRPSALRPFPRALPEEPELQRVTLLSCWDRTHLVPKAQRCALNAIPPVAKAMARLPGSHTRASLASSLTWQFMLIFNFSCFSSYFNSHCAALNLWAILLRSMKLLRDLNPAQANNWSWAFWIRGRQQSS